MNQKIDISGVILKTERLTLRPWAETDLEDLYAYASVDGVGQMAGWMPHREIGESREILHMFMEEKKVFAIEYEDRVVGSFGIEEYEEKVFPELSALAGREIGFVLAKDCWGRGLMPEAVGRVIRWLFEEVKLDFIVCSHFTDNMQSARVQEKCGFKKLCEFDVVLPDGTPKRLSAGILKRRRVDEELELVPCYPMPEVTLAWYRDPVLVKQVDGNEELYTAEKLKGMYDFLTERGYCYYIVQNGVPVGDVTLRDNDEICIVVAPGYQNRHIGRRAVTELLRLAAELGRAQVTAEIYSFNVQSRKMFLAAGFVQTDEEWFEYRLS